MELLNAIALGALQGVTEFLPVSSSGHLRLLSELFGVQDPQTLFDILLHVGSLVAVFVVYRGLFAKMTGATLRLLRRPSRWSDEPYARLTVLAIVATVPTGLIAIVAGDTMEGLAADIAFVGVALIVNAGLLWVLGALQRRGRAGDAADDDDPRSRGRSLEEMTLADALFIGTIQGFGIFRGISRSGSTITAGLLRGLDQEAAAAFSFVMSVPAILGALVMKFDLDAMTAGGALPVYLVGAATSAVVGTVALWLLLRLLRKGRLHLFAWYCLAIGALAITLSLTS